MISKEFKQFSLFLFCTILFGDFAMGDFSSLNLLFIKFLFYFYALYICLKTSDPNTFFDKQVDNLEKKIETIYFLGMEIPLRRAINEEENRFLAVFHNKYYALRAATTFLLLFALLFILRGGIIDFSMTNICFAICSFVLIRASYVGQLLIPLILNAFFFTANLNPHSISSVLPFCIYYLLFFYTIYFFTQGQFTFLQKGRSISYENAWSQVKKSLLVFFLAFSIFFGITSDFNPIKYENFKKIFEYIFTKDRNEKLDNRGSHRKNIALPQYHAYQTNTLKENKYPTAKMDDVINNVQKIAKALPDLNLGKETKQKINYNLNDLNQKKVSLTQKASEYNQFLDDLPSQQNTTKSQTEEFDRLSSELKQDAQDYQSALNELQKNVKSLPEDTEKELNSNSNPDIPLPKNMAESKVGMEENPSQAKDIPLPREIPSKDKELSTQTEEIDSMSENAPPTPSSESEKRIDDLYKIFIFILVLSILIGLIYLFKKFFMKANTNSIKEILIDETEKRELQLRLNELNKATLTPREEVIAYYLVFVDLVKLTLPEGKEPPPPIKLYEELSETIFKVKKHLFEVTTIVVNTVFGDKEVNSGDLLKFKKSIEPIFRIYTLKF